MTLVKYVLLFIIVPCFKVRASEYTGALDRFALVDWRTSPISTQKIANSSFPHLATSHLVALPGTYDPGVRSWI